MWALRRAPVLAGQCAWASRVSDDKAKYVLPLILLTLLLEPFAGEH